MQGRVPRVDERRRSPAVRARSRSSPRNCGARSGLRVDSPPPPCQKPPPVSLFKGSLTYVRLFVAGEPPRDFRERYVKAIRLRAMKPLDPDEDVPERWGWTAPGEPFQLDLTYEDLFYNEYLNLGFRTDRWAIPGPALRAALREAEGASLTRKGREKLSRKEKGELKELVVRRLRKKMPPATRAQDLSWDLNAGIVRCFSHAPRAISAITELFQRTFELELAAEAPYTLAARLGLSREQTSRWDALEPLTLAVEAE